eukprot:XP_017457693.1 PREDICTED: uncharacterized protein KIAA1210 homolog isoform X1 [Rattus norvegicus]
MAESLSEVSSSMEGLEVTEEGKKKSKFKAFKSFFGKKKKKEPEEVSEGTMLKPRFSSSSVSVSSLQPVLEMQVMEPMPKSGMGAKAISHDSVFCADPEPEKALDKPHSSPEPQRSRSLKRSPISRTLPRVSGSSALGGLSGSGDHYSSSSGAWASSSKFTEIQSLRSRRLSISPLIIRSEKVSQDLENLFASDRTPNSSRRRSSHDSTSRKSFSELSSDPELSQSSESSSQQPSGFSTPATSQGCLDSSAAKYKIALNPRKQKKKTSFSSVKGKQEEQLYSVPSKEKTTTKIKQVEQKEQRLDNTGLSSQEQSYKTETQETTIDETLSNDAALSYSILGLHPRRRRRRAKNEWGIIERGLLKSTQGYSSLNAKAESSAKQEVAGGEHSFLQLLQEKKGTGQPTTTEAEITSLQEMPSDKGDVEMEKSEIDVEAERALQSTSTDVAESAISGPPSCYEIVSSEGKKKKDKSAVLPWIRRSPSQEEAQVHMHPSQVCEEEEEASSPDLQRFQSQMELSLESITYHKEKHLRSGLRSFSASVSSATAEDDSSIQTTPLPLRRWPNTGEISSDSKSTSEYESSSEMQPSPAESFQPTLKPKYAATGTAADDDDDYDDDNDYDDDDDKEDEDDEDEEANEEEDDDDVFLKSENVDVELSKMEQQQPLGYSSQPLGNPKAPEAPSELESSSEDERACEEMTSAHSSQSLEEFEECSESRSFTRGSISEEQSAPRCRSPSLQEELEEKELSTESSSYVEKYHSSEDLSSSEEEQQEVSPVSKSSLKQWSAPAKSVRPIHTSPPVVSSTTPQQPPIMVNISVGPSKPVEPLLPSHTAKSWLSPQSEHQVFSEPEGTASDWDIFMQPVSPRKALKGYYVEQNVSSSSDIVTMEEGASMEEVHLRHHSQPQTRPRLEQEVSAGPELIIFEESIDAQPSGYPPQSSVRPSIKKDISLGAESAAFEGSTSLESSLNDGPVGQLHPKYSAQPLPSHQSQPVSESTSVEGAILVELLPPQPSVKPKFQPPMTQDPVSPSIQWSSHMEPTSAKHVFQTQANPKFKQLPVSSNSPEAQGSMSVQLVSTRCPPQPWLTPTFEQISVPPGSVPAAWAIPIYSPAPSMPSQPLIGSVVKQPAARGPMNTSVQQILTVEPKPSRYSLQSWQSTPLEQVSVPPDHAAASWSIPIDPPAPRIPSQPLMGSVFKQPTSTELVNVSVSQSSSRELLPSRFPVQPRADPEHYVPEEGVTTLRRPRRQHSQPSVISEIKEEVSSGSLRASREQSISMETIPSKYAPQPWLGPEFEQQASSLENVAKEENVLTEAWLSGHPSESIIKHKVEKTPSGFESTSVEGGMPWRPVPPTCPTPLSIRSKVQETSCRLDSATAQDSSKKSQNIRSSSQSFVKFMAQQVFSDSATSEMDTYAKPVTARGRSRPSRSLLKPKLDEHVFLYNWDDDEPKKDTKSKNLPTKPPFQSSRRPEEPQEVLALSEGVPGKWNTSVRDVSQSPGKPEYKQNVSVSASFPDEWKRSEGQLPSTQPSQAFDVAELQPPILSADSANVPVEWRIPEGHQPPGQPPQSYLITDYQQQGYGSSPNAAAEGAIPEKNIACWAMLKGPASTKNVNYGQGYRDLTKSTSTSGTKPAKLASAPAQKAFVSMGAYFKEELPQYCDVSGNPSLIPTTKGDVENVFGVRLRKISQKIGMENPDPCESFAPVSPVVSKEQADKGALQDSERGPEKSSTTFNLEEKQGNRPKYESIWKKPAVYRPPGESFVSLGRGLTCKDREMAGLSRRPCRRYSSFKTLCPQNHPLTLFNYSISAFPVCRKGTEENGPSPIGIYLFLLGNQQKDPVWNTIVGNINQTDHPFCLASVLILISFSDKTSSWKADISMEPTWIAMVKQRQRGFGSHFPKKSRARSEIRAETKEPRYETKYDPEMELLSKESESVTDVTAKMTFLSTISRHEMPQSRQFIKSVAFDDQTMLQPYTRERETRRSSSLPPRFIQPQEPEWFLMAKKKAQAWSQMADLMQ